MIDCNRIVIVLIVVLTAFRARADVVENNFGTMPDGTAVRRWTITNTSGASVSLISYGATVVSLRMPDRAGKLDDVVLGFDQFDQYLVSSPYFGAIIGRYGNRIAEARFTLNGIEYHITANDRGNVLHGGKRGFDKVIWAGQKIDGRAVEFSYLSKDGEEGFPGNLTTRVRYTLSEANVLKIEYTATTDKETVVNLTNHSYFNLAGQGHGDVLKHELMIDADKFTPTNVRLIPTGELTAVDDTPFDFRRPHPVGDFINSDDKQIRGTNGYDINFVLTKQDGLRHAATMSEPTTGRVMHVWTTEPGMQLYTGNGLDGTLHGKGGATYLQHGAICLETQHFPNSPNEPVFPTTALKPGELYHTITEYRFGIQNTASPAIELSSRWSLIKTGDADGSIEENAHHPANPHPRLLAITVIKTAPPGGGRVGAASAVTLQVHDGQWFDVRFSAITERASVGLVFSLEGADGKVLASTTLPEIGRGRSRRVATEPSQMWRKYLVALHARAADPAAHLVITPIEPTSIWLDELTIQQR